MRIYFDIETVPGQNHEARDYAAKRVKPPATLKKEESIKTWWVEHGPQAIEDAFLGLSFDALHGEIISIAAVNDMGDQYVNCRDPDGYEQDLIADFLGTVQAWCEKPLVDEDGEPLRYIRPPTPYFVAHNAKFDLGFLWRRMVVLGIKHPIKVPGPDKRAGQHFGCTMERWAGWGKTVSLDNLSRAMGLVSSKEGGMDGSKVYGAWKDGQYAEIEEYNLDDAKLVHDIWHRMEGVS